jgi:hypothetical protein
MYDVIPIRSKKCCPVLPTTIGYGTMDMDRKELRTAQFQAQCCVKGPCPPPLQPPSTPPSYVHSVSQVGHGVARLARWRKGFVSLVDAGGHQDRRVATSHDRTWASSHRMTFFSSGLITTLPDSKWGSYSVRDGVGNALFASVNVPFGCLGAVSRKKDDPIRCRFSREYLILALC